MAYAVTRREELGLNAGPAIKAIQMWVLLLYVGGCKVTPVSTSIRLPQPGPDSKPDPNHDPNPDYNPNPALISVFISRPSPLESYLSNNPFTPSELSFITFRRVRVSPYPQQGEASKSLHALWRLYCCSLTAITILGGLWDERHGRDAGRVLGWLCVGLVIRAGCVGLSGPQRGISGPQRGICHDGVGLWRVVWVVWCGSPPQCAGSRQGLLPSADVGHRDSPGTEGRPHVLHVTQLLRR